MSLKTILLAENPFEPSSWIAYEHESLVDFLQEHYESFPKGGRIYHNHVANTHDVTPKDEASTEHLKTLEGSFIVVIYPADMGVTALVISIIAIAAVITMAILFKPDKERIPRSSTNDLSGRQNRERLYGRIPDILGTVRCTPDLISVPRSRFINNQEVEFSYLCIGRGSYEIGDIKDGSTLITDITGLSAEIYGPGKQPNSSEPDQLTGSLIGEPLYTTQRYSSVNGQELVVENSNVFRGIANVQFSAAGQLDLIGAPEEDFAALFVAGQSVYISNVIINPPTAGTYIYFTADFMDWPITVHFPNNDAPPLNGGDILQISAAFSNVRSFVCFDYGYTVLARTPNAIICSYPYNTQDYPVISGAFETLLQTNYYEYDEVSLQTTIGSNGVLECFNTTIGSGGINLNGTYTILAVSYDSIVLDSPNSINPGWASIPGKTGYLSPVISSVGPNWIKAVTIDDKTATAYQLNFIAPSGIYYTNRENHQRRLAVDVEVELTPLDNADEPILTDTILRTSTLIGSASTRSQCAISMYIPIVGTSLFGHRVQIRVRRTTVNDTAHERITTGSTSVVDTVKWRDLYSLVEVPATVDFGDVTTAYVSTYATLSATSVKERKINMLTTRKLPTRIGSTNTFTTTLSPTQNVADMICAACLDLHIGRRAISELDVSNIYETIALIEPYFGTYHASEFGHAFDQDNESFEEMITVIATAVFCMAYRRGSLIMLSFEKQTNDSILLFNHRNKLPGSETRTISFGTLENYDGVELTYVDPEDEAPLTYRIPQYGSINPRKIEGLGIRSKLHAYLLARRAWNRIQYQNVSVEFEATQEAEILVVQDRILVADNTRTGTQDGEVIGQNVLEVELSQTVTLLAGHTYTIFIQHIDGSIESFVASNGSTESSVFLDHAPRLPLALNQDLYARAVYHIVDNISSREKAFLVSEKDPKDNYTTTLRAVNYDDRYYRNDSDHLNNVVDEYGELV
jgi:hypothetical protein